MRTTLLVTIILSASILFAQGGRGVKSRKDSECTNKGSSSQINCVKAVVESMCKQSGVASWYGPGFHGKQTASGAIFNQNAMTAAHKTLPFGTKVTVVNQNNGKSITVTINDRGPYAHGRIIDLSKKAAQRIGISGTAKVCLKY